MLALQATCLGLTGILAGRALSDFRSVWLLAGCYGAGGLLAAGWRFRPWLRR